MNRFVCASETVSLVLLGSTRFERQPMIATPGPKRVFRRDRCDEPAQSPEKRMRTIRPAVGASARFETLEHESILRQRCYALCVWRLEMDFRGFWRPLRKRSVCHPSRLSRSVTARCVLCVRPLYGRSTTQPVT